MGVASNILELNSKSGGFLDFFSRRFFQKQMHFFEVRFEWKYLLQYLLHKCYDLKVLDGVLWKNENFKNNFFSWSEFCYWTKIKVKYVFNKNNAFKINITSLFCFFMLFRANIFQVEIDNISFVFKFDLTSHQLSCD